MNTIVSLARAAMLGAATGLRSATGVAVVSRGLRSRHWIAGEGGALTAALARTEVANALAVVAAGELVADKLPLVPARIEPGPLLWRALLGGVCGAAACSGRRDRMAAGALVGAGAAVAAAYGGYHLRRLLTAEGKLPDVAVALAEDAVAIGASSLAAGL
ncbi:MAG TPA: hypothetical protein VKT77_02790 [Chthonomonadaceae bacterium]|nr:hypothetical protein [Chthonomonadaceae bacterium]